MPSPPTPYMSKCVFYDYSVIILCLCFGQCCDHVVNHLALPRHSHHLELMVTDAIAIGRLLEWYNNITYNSRRSTYQMSTLNLVIHFNI